MSATAFLASDRADETARRRRAIAGKPVAFPVSEGGKTETSSTGQASVRRSRPREADLDHPPPKRPDDATERAARDPKTSASDQPAREPGKIDREALIAEAMGHSTTPK